MNTKSSFIINFICTIMLSAMPLLAFAAPITTDENMPSVSQEKIVNNTETVEHKTDNKNFINKTAATAVYAPADYYNRLPKPDKPDSKELYERKTILNKTTKTHRICSKINTILQNSKYNKNSIVQKLTNKLNQLDQFIGQYQTITTLDFAPYYFIMPTFSDNYVKKIIFPNDITNITELLPFSLTIQKNTIFKMPAPKNIITSRGISDMLVLMNAPSPQIRVLGKPHFAKLVIDIRNNTLYRYDNDGFPLKAYLVATGASESRTRAGLRIVTYKERFPYSGDPTSKRAQDPYSYGPYIIFVNAINPKTGKQFAVEQLLHGNGSEYSIGKKVSHGCVRTNNSVMKYELSKEVKRGDYILLINPDIG